jgi:hypothetical protein
MKAWGWRASARSRMLAELDRATKEVNISRQVKTLIRQALDRSVRHEGFDPLSADRRSNK